MFVLTKEEMNYLKRAVDLARTALEKGDQPFGSVLVSHEGKVLFEDHNHVSEGDHTQHPEFNIARWAGQNMTEEERMKATVYTSGEHCPMCAAAHGNAKLGRIVYASSSKQLGKWKQEFGVQSEGRVISRPIQEVIRETEVIGPVPEFTEEIRELQRQNWKK